MKAELEALVQAVLSRSSSKDQYLHGERHWRRVGHWGAELSGSTPGADPLVSFLFALFHDSQRINEGGDPGHGRRGGTLAQELVPVHLEIEPGRLDALVDACNRHTDGEIIDDPVVGCCWDADRLDLWRVGKKPSRRFLSTKMAPSLIEDAKAFVHEEPPSWERLGQSDAGKVHTRARTQYLSCRNKAISL